MQFKSQSAMEYLMTYGWAVLIIAIVLLVLFDLGAFSAPTSTSTCIAQSGFLCTNPIITNLGMVYVQFAQNFASPIEISGLGCSNTTSAPNNFVSSYMTLYPGEQITVAFPCQTAYNIGSKFIGTLWIKYNSAQATGLEEQVGSIIGGSMTGQTIYYAGIGNGEVYTYSTLSSSAQLVAEIQNYIQQLKVSNNGYVYVISSNTFVENQEQVSVINNAGEITSNMLIYSDLSAGATTPNDNFAFGWGTNALPPYGIYMINDQGTIVANIPTAGFAYNMYSAPNGDIYAFTYDYSQEINYLYVINPSGEIVANIILPEIGGMLSLDSVHFTQNDTLYVSTYFQTGSSYYVNIVTPQYGVIPIDICSNSESAIFYTHSSYDMYMTCTGQDYIYEINNQGDIVKTIAVNGAPGQIAYGSNGNIFASISESSGDYIDLINSSSGSTLSELQIPGIPDVMAFNLGYLYTIIPRSTGSGYFMLSTLNSKDTIVANVLLPGSFISNQYGIINATSNNYVYIAIEGIPTEYGLIIVNSNGDIIRNISAANSELSATSATLVNK